MRFPEGLTTGAARTSEDPDAGQQRYHRNHCDDLVHQIFFAAGPGRFGAGGGGHGWCLSNSAMVPGHIWPFGMLTPIKIQFDPVVNQPKVLAPWLRLSSGHTHPLPAEENSLARRRSPQRFSKSYASAVVGSMIDFTSAIEFAGNPPWEACSRMIASLGAL